MASLICDAVRLAAALAGKRHVLARLGRAVKWTAFLNILRYFCSCCTVKHCCFGRPAIVFQQPADHEVHVSRLAWTCAALLLHVALGLPAHAGTATLPDQTAAGTPAHGHDHALVPEQARVVLEAIQQRHGKPLPGYVGARPFHNRERRLPPGEYREYDVNPRREGIGRGPERIVIETRSGKAYYTGDHYGTFIPMN